MLNIPPCYSSNKKFIQLIDFYISDGYESYSDLDEIDQEKIASHCVDILGNDAYVIITESDNDHDLFYHFSKFLRTGRSEHSYDLSHAMAACATKFFAPIMDGLFERRIKDNSLWKDYEKDMGNNHFSHNENYWPEKSF